MDVTRDVGPTSLLSLWGFHAATFAALVLQLLEYISDLPMEIEFFSRTSRKPIKYLYAWSRYFGLVTQVSTLALTEFSNRQASWELCKVTFIARGICSQLMMSCTEAILLIRVHALYSCNRTLGRILMSIFIIGTICEISGSSMSIRAIRPAYEPSKLSDLIGSGKVCGSASLSPADLMLYMVGSGLVQGTIAITTIGKIFLNRRSNFLRSPVASLVIRDGIGLFILLAALLSTILSLEFAKGQGPLMWNVSFAWLIALLSIGGCKLVLNTRRLQPSTSPSTSLEQVSTAIEFDTIFSDT